MHIISFGNGNSWCSFHFSWKMTGKRKNCGPLCSQPLPACSCLQASYGWRQSGHLSRAQRGSSEPVSLWKVFMLLSWTLVDHQRTIQINRRSRSTMQARSRASFWREQWINPFPANGRAFCFVNLCSLKDQKPWLSKEHRHKVIYASCSLDRVHFVAEVKGLKDLRYRVLLLLFSGLFNPLFSLKRVASLTCFWWAS